MALYELMAPVDIKCEMRSRPTVSPPSKGCTDFMSCGRVGGCARPNVESCSSGLRRAFLRPSRLVGILKGSLCGGTFGGNGGSVVGAGSGFFGRSRRGSSDLR